MSEALVDEEAPLPEARDRPPTLAHRVEYVLARALLAVLRPIGVERTSALGGVFLRTVGPLMRPVSRRGEDNLRMIYPDWDDRMIRRTVRGVWENLGRTATEYAHLDAFDIDGPDARIEIVGREHVDALRTSGAPIIFVSGHFANWEMLPIALRRLDIPVALVYRAANNPLIDGLIIRLRALSMSRHLMPKGHRAMRGLVEALRAGRSLGMLVDQKLTDGVPAPFMGRIAPTAPAAARLALKFGAPIVYAGIERLPHARFRVTVSPPIRPVSSGDVDADVLAVTTRINALIERDVRARPDQWLWLHRRWGKTLPAPPAHTSAGSETATP